MDARGSTRQTVDDGPAEVPDLDQYTTYEDDGALVVADRENPNAWIRSDETSDVEP